MLRALSFAAALALMLSVAATGFAIVRLAWGNNSCGWDDGAFDCPMTHFIWDVMGWGLGLLGSLAAVKVARKALQQFSQSRKS